MATTLLECGDCGGHFRFREAQSLRCNGCGKHLTGVTEGTHYNPQWDVVCVTPTRTLEVQRAVSEALGLALHNWHTGGGCMALGAALPGDLELLITDGDANLPGHHQDDDELYVGLMSQEHGEPLDEWEGDDIDALVDWLREHVAPLI